MQYKLTVVFLLIFSISWAQKSPVDYVNPFIGTSNFGTTNPGPIAVRGMANVSPFNVAGPQNLPLEKDSRWLSTPYVHENTFLTGFSHVNLSGVGCPELGVILTMPTTGKIITDHLEYGSTYSNEISQVGYYSNVLDKYNIKVEATATTRVGVSKYSFPAGESNILLNLGLGLTNEEGANVKVVSATEIEGVRSVGSFCYYKPEEAYPVYFVARFSKAADEFGVWKKPTTYKGVESEWMGYNGKTRLMKGFTKEVVGDSIGAYMRYNFDSPTQVEMKIGISYVSLDNARENLEKETLDRTFDGILLDARKEWNQYLSKIEVEGGSEEDKTVFYTALYHTLIHPNTLNDVNGDYPKMKTRETLKTKGTRYTVFSLWDTYRNLHQLMSLVYPKQQSDMVKSMLQIYDESGWLPKWELNATETTTMVGDPAGIIIADTYLKGIRDFDVEKAYKAMLKSAGQLKDNPLRPGLQDYITKGYLTTKTTNSGSVSTTQEYNIADYAIAQLAKEMGEQSDYKRFGKRAISYRKLFDKEFNLLRPRNDDGSWLTPYNPESGANFEKNLGFIEGNAWQYTFMVPHDIKGLMKLMGGPKPFAQRLQDVFDKGQFDMANEPDIAYPYLFNYVKGKEYRAQKLVSDLLDEHFKNSPDGIPGNDDTGTMSAWAVFSMMGIYPVNPAAPMYALVKPKFDKITIHLDDEYYKGRKLVILSNTVENKEPIGEILINGKPHKEYFISHKKLVNASKIQID
ncbi:glycoside hydrolase family 92 protein [Maribacter polysiphoniae]|uniref:Glycoside hydrolase family 92 protein n=1 Tax=Maribacter polysiphoniae TaxID=429344 RepID=A0A316E5C0_9FLAO|nr:GH92 family glycosyl hydrolase [Maribacter polysiphoniae]MBD1259278.1 glycoside hydrolase family 92 protein [Maribacter polysiphoniae]PWK24838.1 putative alpha-1,2-mannosidase [Maribacter polysiphoniae]